MSKARPRHKSGPRRPMNLPIGTIRIHSGVRRVKVAMGGKRSRRWMDYALHWWLANKGPVPAGKRVCHADGDRLNDDPANFVLLSPPDVAFLAHERDPAMSERNFAAMRLGAAQANHLRAMSRRRRELLPMAWYPVDFERQQVHNAARRMRWQVYADSGLPATSANWRSVRPLALGWPGVELLPACLLAVLADGQPRRRLRLIEDVQALRDRHGWQPPVTRQAVFSAMVGLKRERLVSKDRQRGGRYSITAAAMQRRIEPCPFVPMRGMDVPEHFDLLRLEDFHSTKERLGPGRPQPLRTAEPVPARLGPVS